MATWIVHLRLAENLLQRIDGLDASYFAIGNIAPDSGIPDAKWENFDPPPAVSHFQSPDSSFRDNTDLAFYREYLEPARGSGRDPRRFSFLLGYFFHLVTDNLWAHEIGWPAKERFAREFEADPRFIWEVKRDWYGLDFDHVRSHPESLFWRVFVHGEYTEDYLDFMPPEAVQERVVYIKATYQKTDEETEQQLRDRPRLYLSQEEMDRFVAGVTERLYEIYYYLWEQHGDTRGLRSALELETE
jgi:hypothetical protein